MSQDNEHIVIVNFTSTPSEQAVALQKIGHYVASFLSQQPGFIASTLHRGLDGTSIVHHARWISEEHFKRAGALAQGHPDLPLLRTWQPQGRGFTVFQTFGGAD
jgi:Antibiotic biosynthesis monooxygenase